jgi:hypothetical protein
MREIDVTPEEFKKLTQLQHQHKWEWPAVFSVNEHGQIWPGVTYGWTHFGDRKPVRGLSKIIDDVADEYLRIRAEGGRFFVDERGAFRADQGQQFVVFQILA